MPLEEMDCTPLKKCEKLETFMLDDKTLMGDFW